MGLIKTIFGGIFSLIGGVFGGLTRLLGLGKKGEYFMDLEEGQAATPAPTQSAPSDQPAKPVAASAPPAAPAAAQKSAPAPTQNKGSATATPAADKPLVTARSQAELQAEAAKIKNFATDYLVNPKLDRTPRRRPGPSVSPFKEMVKDMGKKSPSMG